MKKVYTTLSHKRTNALRSQKSIIKKRKRKTKTYQPINTKKETKEYYEKHIAPKNFSIVENTDETLKFFDRLIELVEKKVNIELDMTKVESLTPGTILYLISLFREWYEDGLKYKIRGDAPKNEECQELFVKSGFYQYVESEVSKNIKADKNIFTIKEGNKCEPLLATKFIKHVRDYIGIDGPTKETKSVRTVLIECMTNTHNHASGNRQHPARWYLMAYNKNNEVHFTFLDSGVGIPSTIQTNFAEEFLRIAPILKGREDKLIKAALDGEFRTSTKEKKRGKGLPKIMSIAQDKIIKESVIISGTGFVNCSSNTTKELKHRFHGTLLSWKIVKGE